MNTKQLIKGLTSALLLSAAGLNVNAESGYSGPSTDETGTGAYYTGVYHDLFVDVLGKSESEVQAKVDQVYKHFFTPGSSTSVYCEVGDTLAYIYDCGNKDVRTEGMSYGMMITVQLDHKTEFDKLWRWAKKYMQHDGGEWDGYFAWQCNTDGSIIDNTCAPDGEEYFVTALLLASNRWGNDGDINYNAEAQNILTKIMNKTGVGGVNNMYNSDNYMCVFAPNWDNIKFGDPSYCLPAFMELWARWSETNNEFWYKAVEANRELLRLSCNTTSGLFPDYCQFDGTPYRPDWQGYDTKQYKYDAIRCAMNVGVDYNWFRSDSANQVAMMTRLLTFFQNNGYSNGYFDWDGTNASGNYNEGVAGTNGVACFAVEDESLTKPVLERLWNTNPPTGQWRYYNGMVYFLSLLNVSGNFRVYKPMQSENPSAIAVNESDNSSLSIYPNPAKDELNIVCNKKMKNAELMDMSGRKVAQTTSNKMNVSHLNQGNYVLKVTLEYNIEKTEKILIK